ncbi:MAG: hypothetical protein HN350_03255 [Phycisphaerales bacterium]|jgi:hypothetical protein|nr:hypothetical protein [Phycisphaerales bacterium]
MNVFLAGIIQGSLSEATIHDQDWRTPIKRILDAHHPEADVYCHYSLHPNSITYDMPEIQATLADGFQRAADCDLLIAYVPSASMGTAIEIYEAARNNAIVLTISPMAPNWVLRVYSDRIFPDTQAFEQFIAAGGLTELIAQRK